MIGAANVASDCTPKEQWMKYASAGVFESARVLISLARQGKTAIAPYFTGEGEEIFSSTCLLAGPLAGASRGDLEMRERCPSALTVTVIVSNREP